MDRAVDLGKAVRAFGTYSELARNLGVPLSTLHGWHRRNKVPHWRAEKIIKLGEARKVDVLVAPPPLARPKRGARRKRVK